MHMYCLCVWCPQRPDEGVSSPGTRITGGCELSNIECWKLKFVPLRELLITAELSLQLYYQDTCLSQS